MSCQLEQLSTYVESLPTWGKAALVGAGALSVYIPYKYFTSIPRSSPLKTDWKEGVVYVYQFPRFRHVPSMSPYCLKLETWLRMAEIHYENVACGFMTRSQEGTLPFVELNGKEYFDSSFIIRDLLVELNKKQMEDHLSEEQKATSRAFETMAEVSLNQSHLLFKVENIDKLIEQFPAHLFGGALFPILSVLFKRTFVKSKNAVISMNKMGKHSREDQISIGSDDLRAISKYLGAKHYFTGFKPTRVDAALFGTLAQIVFAPYENAHLDVIRTECPNLIEYVERIKHRYWPDWGDATTKFSIDSNWKKRPRKESPK